MITMLKIFSISFLVSLILTPIVRKISLSLNYVAKPSNERWHKKPTALFGGVAIYLAFMVGTIFYYDKFPAYYLRSFYGLFLGGSLLFFLGLADDIIHFKPSTKLIGQIIAASCAFHFGVNFEMIPSMFINFFFTILWLVGIANAFNLLDNMDGLSCGIASIVALVLFGYSLLNNIPILGMVSICLAGGSLGFLKYNFHPARIFMGDSGSMFLGFMIAGLAVIGSVGHISNLVITLAVPLLILGVPIFDTTFVTIHRRLNRRPISQGGKDHTSHHLVVLGLSEKKAVLVLYVISLIFGAIALFCSVSNSMLPPALAVIAVVILAIFGIFLATSRNKFVPDDRDEDMSEKHDFNFIYQHKRRIVEVLIDFMLILVVHYTSYLLRFEGVVSDANLYLITQSLPWIVIIKLSTFFFLGLYRGIWRYVSIKELLSVFKAVSLSSVLAVIFITFSFRFSEYSRVVFILDWLLTLFFIAGVRVSIRIFNDYFSSLESGGERVLIYGAGDTGELLLREMRRNNNIRMKIIGFIDDDPSKAGRVVHGVKILSNRKNLLEKIKQEKIDKVLLAIPSVKGLRRKKIIDILNENNIPYREISSIIEEALS